MEPVERAPNDNVDELPPEAKLSPPELREMQYPGWLQLSDKQLREKYPGLSLEDFQKLAPGHAHTPLCGSRDRIVVGVDQTEHSKAALRWAAEEARLRHTHLHVVHTYAEVDLPLRRVADPFKVAARRRKRDWQQELAHILRDPDWQPELVNLLRKLEWQQELADILRDGVGRQELADILRDRVGRQELTDILERRVGPEKLADTHSNLDCQQELADILRNLVRQQELGNILKDALPKLPVDIESVPLSAPAPEEALVAASHGAAIIAVGSHQDNRKSVARRTAALATCPVAILREGERLGLALTDSSARQQIHDRLLVVVDNSFSARDALWFAANEAVFRASARAPGQRFELLVVHVAPTPLLGPARWLLEYLLAGFSAAPDLAAKPRWAQVEIVPQLEGVPESAGSIDPAAFAETIASLSRTADLLVVGALDHRRNERLAPRTEDCLRVADCPVVIVPDTREDREDGGIRQAKVALERMWSHDQGPTSWPLGPPALTSRTPGPASHLHQTGVQDHHRNDRPDRASQQPADGSGAKRS